MNYRHAFHAGNFADVVKHATLARVIAQLKEKPAAFRVIDTHAGFGLYDLTGPEASRTGEWRAGIGRLRAARLDAAARGLLAPYLDAVAAFNPDGTIAAYPGSPALAQRLLRAHDRLVVCELGSEAAEALAAQMRRDARVKVVAIDGYTALNAYVPPKERRGLVLLDPPFEQPDEFERLVDALAGAHRKWPTGIYLIWYPLKDARATGRFARGLARLGIPRILRAELAIARARAAERLAGTGLIVVNPPWRLEGELNVLLPALARALAENGQVRLDWLAGEK
jgi:23S rRNA (adenine2030-N6)-methyltransferase